MKPPRNKKRHHHHHHHGKHSKGRAKNSSSSPRTSSGASQDTAFTVATLTTALDGGAVDPLSPTPPSPSPLIDRPHIGSRVSICEYCSSSMTEMELPPYPDEGHHDCDGHGPPPHVDINCVSSHAAFRLRTPDLTGFFCQSSLLLGELQRLATQAQASPAQGLLDEALLPRLRTQVLELFPVLFRSTVAPPAEDEEDDDRSQPTCPFVMLLSILLPVLRKFLQWIQATKDLWWVGHGFSPAAPGCEPVAGLLASQLVLHDLLTQLIAEADHITALIEENEEHDQDVLAVAQALAPSKQRRASTAEAVPGAQPGTAVRPPSTNDNPRQWLPQIRKISFEFEEVISEIKFELAELTEAILDNAELQVTRLCRPQVTKDATTKSKSTVIEVVETLVHQILDPLTKRVILNGPLTTSKCYIFPKVMDRCVHVLIDEYAGDHGKVNEISMSQFEKASMHLRTWALQAEDLSIADRGPLRTGSPLCKLQLMRIGAFVRLEQLFQAWQRGGKDADSTLPRLTLKTNLEHLRSTFKKTMTARSGALQS